MTALRPVLRQRLWWRVLDARSWLGSHLPVSRDTALRLAGARAQACCEPLERRVTSLVAAMEGALRDAGVEPYATPAGPEPPGPVTQRDLDDAVAALIRDARREYGQGGAR